LNIFKTTFLLIFIFFISCNEKKSKLNQNELSKETSPYLLQHAKNPVNWKAWNNTTLKLAKEEGKLIIISIGYSSCHWCHVMEKESFENDSIAKIMNYNFINIKVDREERPDVDNVYMDAVQLMTGSGGWPLNCITLPDGRPFFGGTYFTKKQWQKILVDISKLYRENPQKIIDFADKLKKGVQNSELITLNKNEVIFSDVDIKNSVEKWSLNFDTIYGGNNDDIKFPMPNSLDFLLRYGHQFEDTSIKNQLKTTLTKMAFGGIYDQINGGFSRYSTDKKWHIPHFEKMLYDNAQLVSLYSKAYLESNNELFKTIITETLDFVGEELTAENGAFYSSLDADSKNHKNELEEGAFYYWKKKELKNLINEDYQLFKKYYNINEFGLWGKERYVLIRNSTDLEFSKENNINIKTLKSKVNNWKSTLKKIRLKKNKPNLDDKVLTSWNALMISGYVNAYKALKDEDYLKTAIKNAEFILKNQIKKDYSLFRNYKNGKSTIDAYSEDYAFLIDAYISLYEVTLDEKWLFIAKELMNYTITYYFNSENGMFYFTSNKNNDLISKKVKTLDEVLPSPNSVLANNLFKLSLYFSNTKFNEIAKQMVTNLYEDILNHPNNYSNWLHLALNYARPFYELAIVGKNAKLINNNLHSLYVPNIIIAGSTSENSNIELLKNKYLKDETYIYVCNLGTCKLPQKNINNAMFLIKK
tara:strand:+ start:5468 stop:7570 length:2103 start_codon:yes stop_codon:yes gene_type:complete